MFLPRRWIRQLVKLAIGILLLGGLVLVSDLYLNFLPPSIQTKLPLHEAAPIVLDIKIQKCFKGSSCSGTTGSGWYKHPKDLFLGKAWFNRAFLETQRVPEDQLTSETKVLLDMAIAEDPIKVPARVYNQMVKTREKVDFSAVTESELVDMLKEDGWSMKDSSAGLWVRKGKYVPNQSITAVKVLFGRDAAYPLPGWTLLDGHLLIDARIPVRLAIRIGAVHEAARPVLKINSDMKFKIVQLADLHMVTGDGVCDHPVPALAEGEPCLADARTVDFVEQVLDNEKPDFIVFSGDQIYGDEAPDPETALMKALAPAISRKIPYALVFGNHDEQSPLDNAGLMEIVQTLPYSLAESGPANVSGVGNYMLSVSSNNHPALAMYFADTHAHLKVKGPSQYDWIRDDQMDLMRAEKQALRIKQKDYSRIPLAMAFFHIPLPEYRLTNSTMVGTFKEAVMGPTHNSGAREVLSELGVSVLSVGHDHCNDYCLYDVSASSPAWLCYGGGAGEGGYGGYPDSAGDTQRRIRVFEVNIEDASITSWKRVRGEPELLDVQRLVSLGSAVDS